MRRFSVCLWGIHKGSYEGPKSGDYLKRIWDIGYNSLIIWREVPEDFLALAKFLGFYIYSLLPEVLSPSIQYDCFEDYQGRNFGQPNFGCGLIWAYKNQERISHDLVDEYVITDRACYISLYGEMTKEMVVYTPFTDLDDLSFLGEARGDLSPIMDFSSKKVQKTWLKVLRPIWNHYIQRFEPILDDLKSKGKEFALPIVIRNHTTSHLCDKSCIQLYKSLIRKYRPNLLLLNASKQIGLKRKLVGENYGGTILGGTEDATGLVEQKNGRKLLYNGYSGFLTNEHQLLNNRHPTWEQIKNEMSQICLID